MPTLDPSIEANRLEENPRRSFIVEISTSTVRRWTPYRGRTSDGRIGLIVDSVYYEHREVLVPSIDEIDSTAPIGVTIAIANADNLNTELWSNAAMLRKAIVIHRVHFDADWAIRAVELWFDGETGTPSLKGPWVELPCQAYMGRRGKSPKTQSKNILQNFAPPAQGWKLRI